VNFHSGGITQYQYQIPDIWDYSTSWKLAYRVDGKNLTSDYDDSWQFNAAVDDPSLRIININEIYGSLTRQKVFIGYSGQRVVNVSCKVMDKYMVYSYILQDYNGPTNENHINDENDTYWDFNSRVLGVISLETGERYVYTVDSGFKDILEFDETQRHEVGVHQVFVNI